MALVQYLYVRANAVNWIDQLVKYGKYVIANGKSLKLQDQSYSSGGYLQRREIVSIFGKMLVHIAFMLIMIILCIKHMVELTTPAKNGEQT